MGQDDIKESAKAVQEIARTTAKGLEVANKVGGFIANLIREPLEQGIGIYKDKLQYYRACNQLMFISKYRDLVDKLNIKIPMQPIPIKLLLPVLAAVSLEDDEYLQDLWVRLLLNASSEENKINIQRSHIAILEQLSSLEARVLEAIYRADVSAPEKRAVLTFGLPEEVEVVSERAINTDKIYPEDPNDDIKLSLANLARLRVVALPLSFKDSSEIYSYVHQTLLGRRFINAVTVKLPVAHGI